MGIMWNEPGSDEDTIDYIRFQRLFGVNGDLDVDVGDQRLQNETELERQSERLQAHHEEAKRKIISAAKEAVLGGVMSAEQREKMELPWVQEFLRDTKVKAATAVLLGEGEGTGEAAFLAMLEQSERLKEK